MKVRTKDFRPMFLTLAESSVEQVGTKFVDDIIVNPTNRGLKKSTEMNEPIYIFKLVRVVLPENLARVIDID